MSLFTYIQEFSTENISFINYSSLGFKEFKKLKDYIQRSENKKEKLEEILEKRISKKTKGLIFFYFYKEGVKSEMLDKVVHKKTYERIERIVKVYEEMFNYNFKTYKELWMKLRDDRKMLISYSTFLKYIKELREANLLIDRKSKNSLINETSSKILEYIKEMGEKRNKVSKSDVGKRIISEEIPVLEYLLSFYSLYLNTNFDAQTDSFVSQHLLPLYSYFIGDRKCFLPKVSYAKELLAIKYLQERYSIKKLIMKELENEKEISLVIPAYLLQLILILNRIIRKERGHSEEWGFIGIGFRKNNLILVEGSKFNSSRYYLTYKESIIGDREVIDFHSHSDLLPTPSYQDEETWKWFNSKNNNMIYIILGRNGKEISINSFKEGIKKIKIYVYGEVADLKFLREIGEKIVNNEEPFIYINENGNARLDEINTEFLSLRGFLYNERVKYLY